MKKLMVAAFSATLLSLAAPITTHASAPTQEAVDDDDDDSDKTGLWGLAGLLGLAGLAGLKRRDHVDVHRMTYADRTTPPPPPATPGTTRP